MLLGIWIVKLRESRFALQKSYDDLEVRIDERTRDLKTEIEDRKQIEQELRDSEERFRSLSDAAFEGIVITEQGKIIEACRSL